MTHKQLTNRRDEHYISRKKHVTKKCVIHFSHLNVKLVIESWVRVDME